MQGSIEVMEGLARLEKIISSFPPDSAHWSEAENRFQFVDRLLTECLGWERPNMRIESPDGAGGRADYVLGLPPKAVLEAKREARRFESIPVGKPTTVRKIEPLLRASKAFADAVQQVLQYCVMKGAQVAVICNGPQLAIFQALTPGYSPLEGECFFFEGFAAYKEHFPLLWQLLSPEGISENRANRILAQHRNPRIPPKASTVIPEPTRFRYRSDFQENLRELSSLLLEEVEDNPGLKSSFYNECYVPLEANNRHLLQSKRIIAARYRRAGEGGVAPSAMDVVTKTDRRGNVVIDEAMLQGAAGSRPIVVIGDVGVGKTSFFENLYEKLSQTERKSTYFLHINLGVRANLSKDVKTFVLDEIPATLKKNYAFDVGNDEIVRAVYREELADFDTTIKGGYKTRDPSRYENEVIEFLAEKVGRRDTHIVATLKYLSTVKHKQIILIMDNADQRTFVIQQEAFLIAQELASSRTLLVFVALRPSTFLLSKMTGALSGYQHKVLAISPPPADEVVLRRLSFAVRVAEGKVAPAALSGIRVRLQSVVLFFNSALRAIRSNDSIRLFLSNITGGNTRAVIELITGFFGSPNVDSEKIVAIEEETGNYKVPLHEFTKHALLGEYAYFNANSSLVACNIFDVSAADPREHFLASFVISFLSSNMGVRDNDGFVSGHSIFEEMSKQGFVENQIGHSLRRLARKKLIETPHSHYRELEVDESESPVQFHYRATTVGIYHVHYWTGSFSFLDAMSTDTPIFDESARAAVLDTAASFDIRDRYQKAVQFRSYLQATWHEANFTAAYYDFSRLLESQNETFLSVKAVLDKPPRKLFNRGTALRR